MVHKLMFNTSMHESLTKKKKKKISERQEKKQMPQIHTEFKIQVHKQHYSEVSLIHGALLLDAGGPRLALQ